MKLLVFIIFLSAVQTNKGSAHKRPENKTPPSIMPCNEITVKNPHTTVSPSKHTPTSANGTVSAAALKPTAPCAHTLEQHVSNSSPKQGKYTIRDKQHKVCIKADMGLQFLIVRNKKNTYYNINSGNASLRSQCGKNASVLSLCFNGGFITFTFAMNGSYYYVNDINAMVTILTVQEKIQGAKAVMYGRINNTRMFETAIGKSYKCNSQQILSFTNDFKLITVNMQIQAFNISNDSFGEVQECAIDETKRIILLILGACLVGVTLVILLIYLMNREHRRGYQTL
ncbi:lysosome-associated membrane glycoprotein 3 isoform X2 [Erpetoichthys calabaricus]|uniref:Lysosome-associated membrane glycoprotein 3-like n=1 Tax=Erpetoichthys calabaricus TaxID=27687 RepID=A0A8C4SL66_ERPCA|nr:lysosome-associated membrane glycoprotein 3 isoform X2 [Erpetoichthys calabaricus]